MSYNNYKRTQVGLSKFAFEELSDALTATKHLGAVTSNIATLTHVTHDVYQGVSVGSLSEYLEIKVLITTAAATDVFKVQIKTASDGDFEDYIVDLNASTSNVHIGFGIYVKFSAVTGATGAQEATFRVYANPADVPLGTRGLYGSAYTGGDLEMHKAEFSPPTHDAISAETDYNNETGSEMPTELRVFGRKMARQASLIDPTFYDLKKFWNYMLQKTTGSGGYALDLTRDEPVYCHHCYRVGKSVQAYDDFGVAINSIQVNCDLMNPAAKLAVQIELMGTGQYESNIDWVQLAATIAGTDTTITLPVAAFGTNTDRIGSIMQIRATGDAANEVVFVPALASNSSGTEITITAIDDLGTWTSTDWTIDVLYRPSEAGSSWQAKLTAAVPVSSPIVRSGHLTECVIGGYVASGTRTVVGGLSLKQCGISAFGFGLSQNLMPENCVGGSVNNYDRLKRGQISPTFTMTRKMKDPLFEAMILAEEPFSFFAVFELDSDVFGIYIPKMKLDNDQKQNVNNNVYTVVQPTILYDADYDANENHVPFTIFAEAS